jgi:hypothetical protein
MQPLRAAWVGRMIRITWLGRLPIWRCCQFPVLDDVGHRTSQPIHHSPSEPPDRSRDHQVTREKSDRGEKQVFNRRLSFFVSHQIHKFQWRYIATSKTKYATKKAGANAIRNDSDSSALPLACLKTLLAPDANPRA